jgi:hypothetical protein
MSKSCFVCQQEKADLTPRTVDLFAHGASHRFELLLCHACRSQFPAAVSALKKDLHDGRPPRASLTFGPGEGR